jgi:predicted nuclease of predicted toxin-antitoxin system
VRFLADMGVSLGVVMWLRRGGHDAVQLRDESLQRWPDTSIFVRAAAERRIILPFDLDFGEIVALSAGSTRSVVLFRLNNTTTPFVIRRLAAVLPDVEDALIQGAIVVGQGTRSRTRRLPLGG